MLSRKYKISPRSDLYADIVYKIRTRLPVVGHITADVHTNNHNTADMPIQGDFTGDSQSDLICNAAATTPSQRPPSEVIAVEGSP